MNKQPMIVTNPLNTGLLDCIVQSPQPSINKAFLIICLVYFFVKKILFYIDVAVWYICLVNICCTWYNDYNNLVAVSIEREEVMYGIF